MESVKISPKKCKIAMALAGHHSRPTTATEIATPTRKPRSAKCSPPGF